MGKEANVTWEHLAPQHWNILARNPKLSTYLDRVIDFVSKVHKKAEIVEKHK